jgi:uncharacterized protein (DUF1330 family)
MPAYAIGRIQATSWQWLDEYSAPVAELIRKHGGRYLVRGGAMDRLEGEGELPSAFVVLEFPTPAQARAWYDDPEYVRWIELRQPHSTVDFIVVDGLSSELAITLNG